MPTGAARVQVERARHEEERGEAGGAVPEARCMGGARIAALVLTLYWCLVLVQAAARSLSLCLVCGLSMSHYVYNPLGL